MNAKMITTVGLMLAVGAGMASGVTAADPQTTKGDQIRHAGGQSGPALSSGSEETSAAREPSVASVANDDRAGQSAERGQVRLVYKPPMRGAPKGRIGGGTRGIGQAFTIAVLAPDHVGLTTQAQPVFYWYAGQSMTAPVEFTLIDGGVEPLIEAALTPPDRPGIYRIELSDYAVRLEPGHRYQWFVALILDRNSRSRDILAGGMIERVESTQDLTRHLNAVPKTEYPAVYADSGIWYDAIDALSRMIDQDSGNKELRNSRIDLLQQVGLIEVAQHDRAQAESKKSN